MYENTYIQFYYQITFAFLAFTQVTFSIQLAWFKCIQMKLLNYFQICKHVQKILKSIQKVSAPGTIHVVDWLTWSVFFPFDALAK